MRKILLALLVVFTITGVSFAGWMPTIVEIPNGNSLVNTFIVGLQVDDEGGITSISDVTITGDVCQVFYGGTAATTGIRNFGYDPNQVFDTHFLDLGIYGDCFIVVGSGWTETQDGSDPAGLGIRGTGIGDLVLVSDATTIAIVGAPDDLDAIEFAQVVVPVGGRATVSGLYTNPIAADAGIPMVPFSFTVPVPEPSTVVLLICSIMGLAGFRFRRR